MKKIFVTFVCVSAALGAYADRSPALDPGFAKEYKEHPEHFHVDREPKSSSSGPKSTPAPASKPAEPSKSVAPVKEPSSTSTANSIDRKPAVEPLEPGQGGGEENLGGETPVLGEPVGGSGGPKLDAAYIRSIDAQVSVREERLSVYEQSLNEAKTASEKSRIQSNIDGLKQEITNLKSNLKNH